MKRLSILLISLSITFSAFAQKKSYKEHVREGNILIEEQLYDLAVKEYIEAWKIDSSTANINWRVGYAMMRGTLNHRGALKYMEKAITRIDKNYNDLNEMEKGAPPLAYFYYAEALHLNYRFDESMASFRKFQEFTKKGSDFYKEAENKIQNCVNAKELIAAPLNVKIVNLGDSINSQYREHTPVLTGDERTIYFSTKRPTNEGGENNVSSEDGLWFEDILVSYKKDDGTWTKPKGISDQINTRGNDATVSLTPDGSTLITYRDDNGDGNIYMTQFDGSSWTQPTKFGGDINTKFYESSACLTKDGNTLYFVSERPGGMGGKDIYKSSKLPNGQWSKSQNIGAPINTPYDEEGPFLSADGSTFYFNSEGHKSMGSYDIFFSLLDENGKFSDPMNLGSPINTPDRDMFYVVSPDGKRGYYASDRDDGFGDEDIYKFEIPELKGEPCLVLYRGKIQPAAGDSLPDNIAIIVTNNDNGEIIGRYRPNKSTGYYTMILPPHINANFSFQQNDVEFFNESHDVPDTLCYAEIERELNLEPHGLGGIRVSQGISLTTTVLNASDKHPLRDAKVELYDVTGGNKLINEWAKTPRTGEVLGSVKPCNEYKVVSSHEGYANAEKTFKTDCDGKSSISAVTLTMDKATQVATTPTVVNADNKVIVKVIDKATKKPIEGATVNYVLKDGTNKGTYTSGADGKFELAGFEKSIATLTASSNEHATVNKDFNFKTLKNGTVLTIELTKQKDVLAATGGADAQFMLYFKYNVYTIDPASADFKKFVDECEAIVKSKGSVTLEIYSSASNVRTATFGTNDKLVQTRANDAETKVKAALAAKGIDASKIKVAKKSALVQGPAYHGDWSSNLKMYEKFQYSQILAK